MLNPSSLETPGRLGCDKSLLHWERGSGPSERRSNDSMCELLTKDACVLHVVRVVPRPVAGATTTLCASYMMSPIMYPGRTVRRGRQARRARLCTITATKICRKYIFVYVHCSPTPQGEGARATKASRDQSQVHASTTDSRSARFPYLLTSIYLSFSPPIAPPPAAAAARRPPLGPAAPTPAFPTRACTASQVTTAPLSPTPPARAGLPRWGDAHNRGLLMVEMGCCAAWAPNQAGPHSAAATRSTMHTAADTSTPLVCAAHWLVPTVHCPPSVSSPSTLSLGWSLVRTDAERVRHASFELVPGDDARVGRVLHVLLLVPLVNEIIAASTVVPVVSVVCCAVRPTE